MGVIVNTAIKVDHLTKDYINVRALDNLNLEVWQGKEKRRRRNPDLSR